MFFIYYKKFTLINYFYIILCIIKNLHQKMWYFFSNMVEPSLIFFTKFYEYAIQKKIKREHFVNFIKEYKNTDAYKNFIEKPYKNYFEIILLNK